MPQNESDNLENHKEFDGKDGVRNEQWTKAQDSIWCKEWKIIAMWWHVTECSLQVGLGVIARKTLKPAKRAKHERPKTV